MPFHIEHSRVCLAAIFADIEHNPSRELNFNRAERLLACETTGLTLLSSHACENYNLERYLGVRTVSESWLFTR